MNRLVALLYGVLAYAVFFATFLYAIGFVGNLAVPRSIDVAHAADFWPALGIDLALLGLFAVPHSVMARPGFKRAWTRVVPEPVERSTFVLFGSLTLLLLFWQWRTLPAVVWSVEPGALASALTGLSWFGWVFALLATFMIDHAHLFGLQQVYQYWSGRDLVGPQFRVRGFYRLTRHPIMTGFVIAFWSTPTMTLGHLVFALASTAYILVALQLEERDLLATFGERYEAYRRDVPMLFPSPFRRASASGDGVPA